jgi:hypothetical protein
MSGSGRQHHSNFRQLERVADRDSTMDVSTVYGVESTTKQTDQRWRISPLP